MGRFPSRRGHGRFDARGWGDDGEEGKRLVWIRFIQAIQVFFTQDKEKLIVFGSEKANNYKSKRRHGRNEERKTQEPIF